MLFALQDRLIFPGARDAGQALGQSSSPPRTELVNLTTDAATTGSSPCSARRLSPDGKPHPTPRRRPTLLYFYGNAMCLNDADVRVRALPPAGRQRADPRLRRLRHERRQAEEAGCHDTADAASRHLQRRKDIDPKKIIAAGWSLGGAVAIDLASRKPVAGLIAFCTFTSMAEMARRTSPLLPTSLLLRHRFDSLSKIGHVTCPILLGHGRRDQLVPSAMSERLAAAATGPS